ADVPGVRAGPAAPRPRLDRRRHDRVLLLRRHAAHRAAAGAGGVVAVAPGRRAGRRARGLAAPAQRPDATAAALQLGDRGRGGRTRGQGRARDLGARLPARRAGAVASRSAGGGARRRAAVPQARGPAAGNGGRAQGMTRTSTRRRDGDTSPSVPSRVEVEPSCATLTSILSRGTPIMCSQLATTSARLRASRASSTSTWPDTVSGVVSDQPVTSTRLASTSKAYSEAWWV